uniref:Uncharacterized protein n=1 Tax=Arundo donax TaxID=35708 RepID=A0A0A9GC03_ARUDO
MHKFLFVKFSNSYDSYLVL